MPKNNDIESAIDLWLESKDEQKYATERTKLRHQTLLLHMGVAGIDVYPFTCPKSGKKKQIVVARDPKAKTLKAPRWNRRDEDAEDDVGDEVVVEDDPAVDNVVEMRRVKRSAEHDGMADPFASTRQALVTVDEPASKKRKAKKRKAKKAK
jgi:hypothetical protein